MGVAGAPPAGLLDTHVHLDDERYAPDLDTVLGRARSGGVWPLVSIGTCLEDSRWAADFSESHDGIYAAVGVHPERAQDYEASQAAVFRRLLRCPKVVAVGEVGLDLHRPGADLAVQETVLRDMIALAREAGLPLSIHVRDAFEPLLRILEREWDPALGGVFHCFSGGAQQARAALDLNFDIAVGGVLTFKNAGPLRGV
ncbi:MAG: TatD family hydrolase, partial [bacterium]